MIREWDRKARVIIGDGKKVFFRMINPWMAILLRSPLSFGTPANSGGGVPGRKTGKHYRIPLSYLMCDDRICCLTESTAIWWRNLDDHPGTVDVWLRGKKKFAASRSERCGL